MLVSWHETVEGQDSCTCKLLKPFNGIKHVKITGYKTLMKIYVDKYSKKYCHVLLNIRCIFLMMVLTYSYVYYLYYDRFDSYNNMISKNMINLCSLNVNGIHGREKRNRYLSG